MLCDWGEERRHARWLREFVSICKEGTFVISPSPHSCNILIGVICNVKYIYGLACAFANLFSLLFRHSLWPFVFGCISFSLLSWLISGRSQSPHSLLTYPLESYLFEVPCVCLYRCMSVCCVWCVCACEYQRFSLPTVWEAPSTSRSHIHLSDNC